MSDNTEPRDTTQPRQVRVAQGHWDAYNRVCKAAGITRAQDINDHIRTRILASEDPEAIRLLEQADKEVATRRARMHPGRPRLNREPASGE